MSPYPVFLGMGSGGCMKLTGCQPHTGAWKQKRACHGGPGRRGSVYIADVAEKHLFF